MIALPPAVADAFGTVDHQRLDVERLWPGRRRQTGVSTAHHETGRITVEEGARFGPPLRPVRDLPVSFVGSAVALQSFGLEFVSLQRVDCGPQGPRSSIARVVDLQPHRAGAGTQRLSDAATRFANS